MNIQIKELFGSDTILTLTEKLNFNFDQITLAGGGPEGPQGPEGTSGPAGSQGIRGSQWFGATGATGTINSPSDGIFRENDFKLNENGDVVYYDNGNWISTNISLIGPTGPKGEGGDGSISIIKGSLESINEINSFVPEPTNLGDFLTSIGNIGVDNDDKIVGDYIDSGIDFITLGRGNNSLVLGRYASLFYTGVDENTHRPAGGTASLPNIPAAEKDIPMLLISQNDYFNPTDNPNDIKNGISIGLTKTHDKESYLSDFDYGNFDEVGYDTFTNLSIHNRYFDFKIKSKGMLTLSSSSETSSFRLGQDVSRNTNTDVHDISTKLVSPIYTEFSISDNLVIDLISGSRNYNVGQITLGDFNLQENKKVYLFDNDLRNDISKSFITNEDYAESDANELVFINNKIIAEITEGSNSEKGKKYNTYNDIKDTIEFDSNKKSFPFKIGQTTINIGVMDGISSTNAYNKPEIVDDGKIHINYQGFGYDPAFIQYSGIDSTFEVADSINTSVDNSSLESIKANGINTSILGYNSLSPISYQQGSRSIAKMCIFPGLLREEKDSSGQFAGQYNGSNRKLEYFDVGHRILPTGSLDLYGTVRLRELGTTNKAAKNGHLAINKYDGIVGFERAQNMDFYKELEEKIDEYKTKYIISEASNGDWYKGVIEVGELEIPDSYTNTGTYTLELFSKCLITTRANNNNRGLYINTYLGRENPYPTVGNEIIQNPESPDNYVALDKNPGTQGAYDDVSRVGIDFVADEENLKTIMINHRIYTNFTPNNQKFKIFAFVTDRVPRGDNKYFFALLLQDLRLSAKLTKN